MGDERAVPDADASIEVRAFWYRRQAREYRQIADTYDAMADEAESDMRADAILAAVASPTRDTGDGHEG